MKLDMAKRTTKKDQDLTLNRYIQAELYSVAKIFLFAGLFMFVLASLIVGAWVIIKTLVMALLPF